jgi:hypothetical protein
MVAAAKTRKPYGLITSIGIRSRDTRTYIANSVIELYATGRVNAANENKSPPTGLRNHKPAAAMTIIHCQVAG